MIIKAKQTGPAKFFAKDGTDIVKFLQDRGIYIASASIYCEPHKTFIRLAIDADDLQIELPDDIQTFMERVKHQDD